jgi:catechol 2,3-dioxygenase-like lactoylglutathione lyase family enzyme
MFADTSSRYRRRRSFAAAAASIAAAAGLLAITPSQPAMADMGPCTTAAPTTGNVLLLVSNVDASARWYRAHAGLAEESRWADPGFGGATFVRMRRNGAGVTLVASSTPNPGAHDPQMVCLVLSGPPAPPAGSRPIYLADPDGTSVELPPASSGEH